MVNYGWIGRGLLQSYASTMFVMFLDIAYFVCISVWSVFGFWMFILNIEFSVDLVGNDAQMMNKYNLDHFSLDRCQTKRSGETQILRSKHCIATIPWHSVWQRLYLCNKWQGDLYLDLDHILLIIQSKHDGPPWMLRAVSSFTTFYFYLMWGFI